MFSQGVRAWGCAAATRRVIAAVACGILLTQVSESRVLELEDFLDLQYVSNPRISPDGKRIAYYRRHVDKMHDRWESELWLVDADGGNNRYLGQGRNAQWLPDSHHLAYSETDNGVSRIVVQAIDSSETTTVVSTGNRIVGFKWSPDGRRVAFTATVPMDEPWPVALPGRPLGAQWEEEPLIVERLHYRIDGQGLKTGFDHVFVANRDGNDPRQLTRGDWDVGARAAGLSTASRLEWGRDGDTIYFDGWMGDESLGMSSHVYSISVSSGKVSQLTTTPGFWSSPRVSPNGRQLAYIGYAGTTPDQETYPGYQIRVMNIDGSRDRTVRDAWEGRIYTQVAAVADFFEWRPDGDGLYVTRYDEGATRVAFLSLDGRLRTSTPDPFGISSMSTDGKAAGTISTSHRPNNVATVRLRDGDINQITHINAELLEQLDLGEVEEIWYESDPGVRVQGWIVKPPGFDESREYPLILSIHGGPHAMYGPDFNFSFQDFAARGYVVLYANPRGSLGYGIDFANAINDSVTGDEALADLMAGIDAVLARGYVDESRLNVTGCSGGGLLTNWIVTQTDRFRSAAALCSISNWISFAGTADIVIGVHHFFDKRFWEDPTSWLEHSAISFVGNVATPTLLMTGEKDLRTPIAQAEEFYAALKMRGISTKLISMKNEYHGTGRRVPSNFLRTQLYLQKWFAENGGGPR